MFEQSFGALALQNCARTYLYRYYSRRTPQGQWRVAGLCGCLVLGLETNVFGRGSGFSRVSLYASR